MKTFFKIIFFYLIGSTSLYGQAMLGYDIKTVDDMIKRDYRQKTKKVYNFAGTKMESWEVVAPYDSLNYTLLYFYDKNDICVKYQLIIPYKKKKFIVDVFDGTTKRLTPCNGDKRIKFLEDTVLWTIEEFDDCDYILLEAIKVE